MQKNIWLEIGFGGGRTSDAQAKLNPDIGIIGCEPYINGLAMLLRKLSDHPVITLDFTMEMREIFLMYYQKVLSRKFFFYIQIHGQKKHHRRRFVTQEFLRPLHNSMKAGSILRIATDIEDYVRQTLQEAPKAGFRWLAKDASDWRSPWCDWISTRYELKALKRGRVPHYLTFVA